MRARPAASTSSTGLCPLSPRSSQPAYLQGLRDLQAKTQQLYPDAGKFSALTSEQQIKMLTEIEKTPFFNMVRTHTVIGFFTRPVHGGNHDKIGWKLIGYDDSLNHKPPFGYYDAQPQKPPRKACRRSDHETVSDIN